jgi:hypothetical protein
MTLPCLSPSPRISLLLTGSPNSLVADVIPSEIVGNGVFLADDGLYTPGLDDILGLGFPAIPVGSVPGDLWVKTAPVANVAWTFRYNPLNTATSKWEFIGGADYYADIETTGTIASGAASGTYGGWLDLNATDVVGPDFKAPFSGTYLISFGAEINPLPGEQAQVGLSIAGADPTDDDTATAGASFNSSVMRRQSKALNSGDLVRLYYRGTGTATGGAHHAYTRRWISVTPVRVTGTRASGTYPGT